VIDFWRMKISISIETKVAIAILSLLAVLLSRLP
jgi:hypothetical protein